jgi:hypothetical protein
MKNKKKRVLRPSHPLPEFKQLSEESGAFRDVSVLEVYEV